MVLSPSIFSATCLGTGETFLKQKDVQLQGKQNAISTASGKKSISRVNAFMFPELVRREEGFLANLTFEGADLEVATPVVSEEGGFRKLFAAFQAFERLRLIVTRP